MGLTLPTNFLSSFLAWRSASVIGMTMVFYSSDSDIVGEVYQVMLGLPHSEFIVDERPQRGCLGGHLNQFHVVTSLYF